MERQRSRIGPFLAITFALSALCWWRIIEAGTLAVGGGLFVLALMWCPGIAAILSRLVIQGNLRGQGWAPWRPRALAIAYLLPVAYCLPVYGLAWLAGWGGFAPGHWAEGATMVGAASSPAAGLAMSATLGVAMSLISAAGEELGWRGYLVPALAERLTPRAVVVVSSLIWAAWHLPIILFADYGVGTPLWFGVPCFVAMIVAFGAILAWLRMTSGSVWPAALFHASHNLFVEGVFDGATVKTRITPFVTGEFGVGLVVTMGIAAWILTRRWLARPGDQSFSRSARA